MLGLGGRLIFWLALIGAGAYGIYWATTLDQPVYLNVVVGTIKTTTGVALLSFITLIALLVGVLAFVLRGMLGLGQLWTMFGKMRFKRGMRALSESLVALAEQDGKRAVKAADKAERYLGDPDLTRLVSAQAAQLVGDETRATHYYELMAEDRETSFVGLVGLLRQALAEQQPERALALAERAHAVRPKDGEVMDALFTLQLDKGDWAGARDTLRDNVRAGRLTQDVGQRRRAVLFVAEAEAKRAAGDAKGAHGAALAALRLAPGLPAAAALAARCMAEKGETRAASRALIAAWRIDPHPDVAAAYAELAPEESMGARRRRFAKLFEAKPDAEESRLLKAELALADEDGEAAQKALGDLPETSPSARAFALRAAVEQGMGAPEETVRAWLARAAAAPRGPRWICESCGEVAERWTWRCEVCGAFDSLVWRSDDATETPRRDTLFPLLASAAAARGAVASPFAATAGALPSSDAAPAVSAPPTATPLAQNMAQPPAPLAPPAIDQSAAPQFAAASPEAPRRADPGLRPRNVNAPPAPRAPTAEPAALPDEATTPQTSASPPAYQDQAGQAAAASPASAEPLAGVVIEAGASPPPPPGAPLQKRGLGPRTVLKDERPGAFPNGATESPQDGASPVLDAEIVKD
ncbi:MAG: heme biosynthesis HemY N-terminal domain-containing protein [Pseudomonadota bacterium]